MRNSALRGVQQDNTPPLLQWFLAVLALLAILIGAGFVMVVLGVRPGHGMESEWQWLRSWISTSCCVSNRCCFEVLPGTVKQVSADMWLVVASGQTIQRTGWSKDHRFWRCACDQDGAGRWEVHDKAHTRCIFPPRPMM